MSESYGTVPYVSHIKAVAAAIETTAGTSVSLSSSNAALLMTNPDITDDTPMLDRTPAMPSLGQYPSAVGLPVGKFKAKCELKGKGSSGLPLWASTLLQCCGFGAAVSGVLTPTSSVSAKNTCTVGIWTNGFYQVLAGVMLDATLTFERGKLAEIEFDGQGIPQAPVDGTTPVGTQETTAPIKVADDSITIGGSFNPIFEKFTFKLGNEIIIRDYTHALIVGRKPMIDIDPEMTAVATYDAFGIWKAATLFDTNIVLNGGTNNTITIDASATQYRKVETGDRKGVATFKIQGQVNRNSNAGDDDYTITFT